MKTYQEFKYDLFMGFAVAIEVAWTLYGLNILRNLAIGNPVYLIDFGIFLALGLTGFGDELIIRRMFIKKKNK